MLDPQIINIVKSTAPLIAELGTKLTTHFYHRMFHHHPELKDIFNMANQSNGDQRQALFNAVYAYAQNIDNLEVLLPAVEKIAQKHASFNITAGMYNIVGENLLATIDELLNPGQEVLDAWAQAYALLAEIFINREEEIYQHSENAIGGWRGTRSFKLIDKIQESEVITSFIFAPIDEKPVIDYLPGQYLAIYLSDEEFENKEIRQYSLSAAPNGKTYRISVKKEDNGLVSSYLHNKVEIGDQLELAPPAGDFFFKSAKDTPITLISAGVGLTPMLSMLETLSGKHSANIHWIHAAQNSQKQAFNIHINQLLDNHHDSKRDIWFNEPSQDCLQSEHFDHQGLLDLNKIADIQQDEKREFYLCGPIAFMQLAAKQLTDLGVNKERIHYECFGPHKII